MQFNDSHLRDFFKNYSGTVHLKEMEKDFYRQLFNHLANKKGKIGTTKTYKPQLEEFFNLNKASATTSHGATFVNTFLQQAPKVVDAFRKYTKSLESGTLTQNAVNKSQANMVKIVTKLSNESLDGEHHRYTGAPLAKELTPEQLNAKQQRKYALIEGGSDIATALLTKVLGAATVKLAANNQAEFLNKSAFEGRNSILSAITSEGSASAEYKKSTASAIGEAIGGTIGLVAGVIAGGVGAGVPTAGAGISVGAYTMGAVGAGAGAATGKSIGDYFGQHSANTELINTQKQALKTREIFASYDLSRMQGRIGGTDAIGSYTSVYKVNNQEVPITGKIASGIQKLNSADIQYLPGAINLLNSMYGKQTGMNVGVAAQYAKQFQNLGFGEQDLDKVGGLSMLMAHGKSDRLEGVMENLSKYNNEYGKLTVDKLSTLVDLQKIGIEGDEARKLLGSNSNNPFGVQSNLTIGNQSLLDQKITSSIVKGLGYDLPQLLKSGFTESELMEAVPGAKTADEARKMIAKSAQGYGSEISINSRMLGLSNMIPPEMMLDFLYKNTNRTESGESSNFKPKESSPEQKSMGEAISNLLNTMTVTTMHVDVLKLGDKAPGANMLESSPVSRVQNGHPAK